MSKVFFDVATTATLLILLTAACNNSPKDKSAIGNKPTINTPDTPAVVQHHDSLPKPNKELQLWLVDYENKTKKKNAAFNGNENDIDTLIKGLNAADPSVKLEKVAMKGDTLFTRIIDAEYLTERIGSYGALAYIANVVINLTSVKNINFVAIDFEDGSHLSAGIWSKKEFSNYKEVD